MKEHRMFSLFVIDSDAFLDMPLSAQAIYFHLCMRADDDGFVNNPKKIQRMIGGSEDDYKLLVAKQFLIPFDTGVIVIKHWRLHNTIRKDMYKKTLCTQEAAMIEADGSKVYQIKEGNVTGTVRIRNVSVTDTARERDENVSLREEKLREDNLSKDKIDSKCGNKGGMGGKEIIQNSSCSIPVKEKLIEFLRYREEIKKPYPESSLRILVKETFQQEQRHDTDAIVKLIEESIRNGWQGIFFDRLDRQQAQKINPHTQKLIDIGHWGKQFEQQNQYGGFPDDHSGTDGSIPDQQIYSG